jgi:hypothetical protein
MNQSLSENRLAQPDCVAITGVVHPTLHAGSDFFQGDLASLVGQEQGA